MLKSERENLSINKLMFACLYVYVKFFQACMHSINVMQLFIKVANTRHWGHTIYMITICHANKPSSGIHGYVN